MDQATTYALLSANAYWDVRTQIENRAPIPSGWVLLDQFTVSNSGGSATPLGNGFSARVFKGPTGEIVISYAGTEFPESTSAGEINDFISGNVPLALGLFGEQAYQAAVVYQKVKAALGANANISFTGHSLGGGLAGLMSVYFNRSAIVFDPAPFEKAASGLTTLVGGVEYDSAYVTLKNRLHQAGYYDAVFDSYLPVSNFSTREAAVKSFAIAGELLESIPLLPRIEGSRTAYLQNAAANLSAGNKHSIDLLAALMINADFAQLAQDIPSLLPMLFDEGLYGSSFLSLKVNLLATLLRNEVGVYAEDTGAQLRAPNSALTKFVADITKLKISNISTKPDLQKALIVAAMEYYYFKDPADTTALFSVENGSIHFKYSDIGASSYKSLALLANAVQTNYLGRSFEDNVGDANLFNSSAVTYQDLIAQDSWFIQVGGVLGLITTTGTSGNDVIIGSNFADNLNGGVGRDIIIAGNGADVLDGGAGADILAGGTGNDTYVIDDANDKMIEISGSDTDLVKSSISFVLTDGLENLTLTGTEAINGTGNSADNIITGNSANNILSGGAGSDKLIGGAGLDTYIFSGDFGSDTIVDRDGQIQIGNLIADGGEETAKNSGIYLSADGQLKYIKTGGGVLIYQLGTSNTLVGRISYLRNPPNKKLSINDEIYSWKFAA